MLFNNPWKTKIPKKTIFVLLIIVCIFVSLVVFFNSNSIFKKTPSVDSGILKAYFLNVGEADCSLVLFPNGESLLIDAGHKSDGKSISVFLKKNNIKKLNYVLATHPDKDHIGGLVTILNDFEVENIYAPDVSKDSKAFSEVASIIERKNLSIHRAYGGDNMLTSNGLRVDFLAPNSPVYKDINDYSAVIKIEYKQTSFLFMGDAGETSENEMLQRYNLLANVVKIPHHGEKSSTSQALIDSIKPQYAIISATNYDSNPPYEKVMDRLKKAGVTTFVTGNTGFGGSIVLTSDGQSITAN